MAVHIDQADLWVHVVADQVWYSVGNNRPTVAALKTASEQLSSLSGLRGIQAIRILGTPENAPLIAELIFRRLSCGEAPAVLIGSPAACQTPAERGSGELALQQARQLDLPHSVGGWHTGGIDDYIIYSLVAAVFRGDDAEAAKHVRCHPAWPAFSFLPDFDEQLAAQLLAMIVDPRWYVDPEHPNRRSKLFSFLGLTDDNMQSVLTGTKCCGRHALRAQLVVDAWTSGQFKPDLAGIFADPRYFLWRHWDSGCGGARGMLRTCQRFVWFLRDVWLQALAPQGRVVFAPQLFFVRADEAVAFTGHWQRCGKSI